MPPRRRPRRFRPPAPRNIRVNPYSAPYLPWRQRAASRIQRAWRQRRTFDVLTLATGMYLNERWMEDIAFLRHMDEQTNAYRYRFIYRTTWHGRDRVYQSWLRFRRTGRRPFREYRPRY